MTRPGLNNRVARLERQRAEAEQLGAEILEWLATATPDEVTEVARFLRERIPPFGQPAPYVDEETARFNALPPAARRQASLDLAESVIRCYKALDGSGDDDE